MKNLIIILAFLATSCSYGSYPKDTYKPSNNPVKKYKKYYNNDKSSIFKICKD